jgi:hypothetical protein
MDRLELSVSGIEGYTTFSLTDTVQLAQEPYSRHYYCW